MSRVEDHPVYDPETTMVLYPGEGALTARELLEIGQLPQRVVVIDSSWNKSNGVLIREPVGKLRRIKLETSVSAFWRFKTTRCDDEVLNKGCSTIEAIFFLCREIHMAGGEKECHCFDNLLWYFDFFHKKVLENHT